MPTHILIKASEYKNPYVFAAIDSDREIESCELCPPSVAVDFEVPGEPGKSPFGVDFSFRTGV